MSMTLSGDGSITGLVLGGLPDATIQTADIVDANVTPAKLSQPLTLATALATTSGTTKDFTVPTWAKRITFIFNQVGTNGTSVLVLQVGTGGVIQTTNYRSSVTLNTNQAGSTTAFVLEFTHGGAAAEYDGFATLVKHSTGIWTCSGTLARSNDNGVSVYSGAKYSIGGEVDIIRLTTAGGTDTFDNGSVAIMYE
jgi:hypothetical protein